MTIQEFTSTIINTLRSNQLDDWISREYVYNVGVNIGKLIVKRESDSKKIFSNTALYSKLDCVKMEPTSASKCGYSFQCNNMMKSVDKIPASFLSNFGSMIQVFNINQSGDYKEISPIGYKNILASKYKPRSSKYFWIDNDYLYIPNTEIELVVIYGLFTNPEEVNKFNGESICKSVLDSKFPLPDYMLSTVIDLTIAHIFNSKKVNVDSDSNLNNLDKQ